LKLKITDRAKAEFAFYRDTSLDMIGRSVGVVVTADPNGHSALECWWAKDTHGKTLPCHEPELLAKVIRSKQSVNLQVKLWAEDVAGGVLLRQAELVEYVHGWPEWVLRAVMEQAGKIATRIGGIAPRFARAEYLWSNLWLPEMDSFDASI
jgi:hypothetical protein